ncbi:MAG: hypothetical protein PWR13_237 [Archaeoglobi archaeon]|nr:hypothetical protein [Candidatus Mnemosynella bozhongmuii]MDI3502415.1 hypothetical protein [Archaeoglobi archaeon]MDK2781209.1 hypothetical protein [Archaeoglobi archaeon]
MKMDESAGTCRECGGELKVEEMKEERVKKVRCRCERCNRIFLIYFDEEWNFLEEHPEERVVENEKLYRILREREDEMRELLTAAQIDAVRGRLENRDVSPSNLSRARRRLRIVEELTGVRFEFMIG